MTDKYTTVRLDRTVHNEVASWASRWGITRTDALTMLVRRGLGAATSDAPDDAKRLQREAESALARAQSHAKVSRAEFHPEPIAAPIVTGLANGHLAELTAAVELLRGALESATRPRPAPTASETRLAAAAAAGR